MPVTGLPGILGRETRDVPTEQRSRHRRGLFDRSRAGHEPRGSPLHLPAGHRRVFWASMALFCGLWGVLVLLRLRLEHARAALADLELVEADRP